MCSGRVVGVLPSMAISGATPHIGYQPCKDVQTPTLEKKPLCDSPAVHNACIRWMEGTAWGWCRLSYSCDKCCNRAQIVRLRGRCTPTRSTRRHQGAAPDGEARSRLLHAGICSVEVVAVRVG